MISPQNREPMEPASHYKGKRVLVSGGAGAIGGNLCRALAEAGAEVTILDDFSSAETWNAPQHAAIRLCTGDILDEKARRNAFAMRPDIVFHLAAFFANQNSVEHPEQDLMTNGMGTLRMLESSRESCARFVYASSGCSIYGDSPLPLREEFVSTHLRTPYQITKMLGELYCNFFFHHYQLPVVKARLFNSYGPGEIPGAYRNVIPNFIYLALKGLPLPITGTGEETRDFTFTDDIVDGLLRAGANDHAVGDEFNIASGVETRVTDVAATINRLTGNSAGVTYVRRRAWDTKSRLLASIGKAEALLGYRPQTRFEDGIARTVDWFRTHWDEIDSVPRLQPTPLAAVRS